MKNLKETNMESPSLERVNFQYKSTLASKMVNACQEAIDDLKVSRKMDGSKVVKADSARISIATKTLRKSFIQKLIDICKDELNLAINVEILQDVVFLNAMTYTEYKEYSDDEDWATIHVGYSTFSGTQDYSSITYDQDYFKKYAENVNLDVSKLKKYTKDHITYLYIYTTTFMSEEIVDPAVVSPVTAEEIAAVILHELGHALTILEHMGDVYNRSELAANTVKYLNEKADNKTLLAAVSDAKEHEIKEDTQLEKLTDMLYKLKDKVSNVIPLVAIQMGFYLAFFIFMVIYTRLSLAGRFGSLNSKFSKTSDTVVTLSNESYMERIADEFVSRHGLGAPLASVLARLSRYWELGHEHDTFSDAVRSLGLLKATLLSYKVITDFLFPFLIIDAGTYDPDWLRLEHLLLNNMVVFKDEKLDPEVRDYFIKETKILINVVDKFKSRNTFKLKQLVWGTIFRILSRSSLTDSFSTAGLSADYDKLQLLTNGLIKNHLYLHAARLQSLQK